MSLSLNDYLHASSYQTGTNYVDLYHFKVLDGNPLQVSSVSLNMRAVGKHVHA